MRQHLADFVVAGVLVAVMVVSSFARSAQLPPEIYEYRVGQQGMSDVWFDADLPRMACAMTDRLAIQFQISAEHPLLPLATFVPARLVRGITSDSAIVGIRRVVALFAGAWILACYLLLRLMGCRVPDALAFALLAAASAAGVFWTVVPEMHLAGSITLMAPLGLLALEVGRRRFSDAAYMVASAASLSRTISNWISGIAAALIDRGWRQGIQISANALVLVSVAWAIHSAWFPQQVYFLGSERTIEKLLETGRPNPLPALVSFVSHSVVMPEVTVYSENEARDVSVQTSLPGSSGAWGIAATLLWGALLAVGAWQMARTPRLGRFKVLLAVILVWQVALHSVFGRETFLYSIQFVPFLIAVAAFGTFGPHRTVVVALTCALVVTAGVNNWRQFERATALVNGIASDALATGPGPAVTERCQ